MNKKFITMSLLANIMCLSACATSPILPKDSSGGNGDQSKQKESDYSTTFNPDAKTVKLLKGLPEIKTLSYDELHNEEYLNFVRSFNNFSNSFSEDYMKANFAVNENKAISPLSIYFAMAQAGSGAANNTQKEIFDAIGISYEQAIKHSSTLYRAVNRTIKNEYDELVSIEDVNNSLWFEQSLKFKDKGIATLVDSFFCEPYAANFKTKYREVSENISQYISDKTRGLIKPKLNFDDLVRMVICNTLYMKDQWNYGGYDLPYEQVERSFKNYDGTTTKTKFLTTGFIRGQAYKTNDFTSFYAATSNGFKLRFIVPENGKDIKQIFTKENLLEAHNANYSAENVETRCIFPEFTASEDIDLISLFKSRGISDFFVQGKADLSNILEENPEDIYCTEIRHITKLIVDKKGIEGAAVTIVVEAGTAIMPANKEEDFIVDKAFGFELSDYNNVPLFTGIINKI